MLSRAWRRLVCFAWNHKWHRAYPDPDTEDGYFLRCARCGKERDSAGPGRIANAIGWAANH